jgi:photosystem II stability/assembly factor-like uncharacterized protein
VQMNQCRGRSLKHASRRCVTGKPKVRREAVLGLHCWLVSVLLLAPFAHAHDPSAWGGTYRTRDLGATWLSVDAGLFVGGSLDIAINPADPDQLLYATDTRLLRSVNGGRDWKPEAPEVFYGPTLAVAFLRDGTAALAANASGVFRAADGVAWSASKVPAAAIPVRRILASNVFDTVVLLGARGVYVSHDHGESFVRSGEAVLPDEPPAAALFGAAGQLFVVIAGDVWTSADGIGWERNGAGLPHGRVETIARDIASPSRMWAAGADQLFISDDGGITWRARGRPMAEAGTAIRGIAADEAGRVIVLSTHRGALRSQDSGQTWALAEGGTLPVHLEAGPLVPDPHHASTLYLGFSLMPYPEMWRRAEQGTNLLSQIDAVSLAGGAAFLALLMLAGAGLVRYLMRADRGGTHAAGRR